MGIGSRGYQSTTSTNKVFFYLLKFMPAIMDAADVLEDPTSIDSEAVEELATHRVSPIAEEGPAAPEADVESTTSSKAVDDIAADIALLRESLSNGHASEAESSTAVSVADSSTETDPPKEKARRDSSTTRASTRSRSGTNRSSDRGHVRRLSASKIQELTEAPDSLPVTAAPEHPLSAGLAETINRRPSMSTQLAAGPQIVPDAGDGSTASRPLSQPPATRRNTSTQPSAPVASNRRNSYQLAPRPAPLNLESCSNLSSSNPPSKHPEQPSRQSSRTEPRDTREPRPPSPIPPTIPLPPLSVPTLLQLELAAQRPSPLYIHQSYANDLPYESSAVKFERLKNFLLLPQYLERLLVFGALACLDAWLWTFTILPMRFFIALGVLINWWGYILMKEARWLVAFVWEGLGRMWRRARRGRTLSRTASSASLRSTADEKSRSRSGVREVSKEPPSVSGASTGLNGATTETIRRPDNLRTRTGTVTNGSTHMPSRAYSTRSHNTAFRHRRTKSMPSNLTTFHKADLLQGAIIIFSSIALMNLDASRMYHFVRAQSAVKLYVIYNLVEVGDRLLSALGQDIFECLFSSETLSRNSSGRSKILLPFGMFLLSLVYNCAHAVTLFYQVITLNVCVNSYSNALLTLLMSNQFVEIKSSVFKRFEKENTFQLTCADIVERFQLWVVLLIIAMRNIVEVGGLSVPGAGTELGDDGGAASSPLHSPSILPASFTLLPTWFWSGEVLSPFLIVIGSEMLVDWIKHAYINKFNNIKPNFYSRILDILCKDYYTNVSIQVRLSEKLLTNYRHL